MARSSYVYMAVYRETGVPMRACTVKREFVHWLRERWGERIADALDLWRIQDNGMGCTRLSAAELLGDGYDGNKQVDAP